MQKHVNLVDLVKSFPTNIFLQNLASIQKRTSPTRFAHLAEKSGKGSISNPSTEVLASEIADLEAEIAEANEAMAKATKIREKENSDYQEEKAYMETTLSSLHAAIEVLGGAGTKKMMLLKAASMVRTAILDSPKLNALSADKLRLMKTFFEDPVAMIQEPVDYYDQKAQAKASYSPQSATIMGILKDMYDTLFFLTPR